MAATYILSGGTSPHPHCVRAIFLPPKQHYKKPSQLHYSTTIIYPKSTKKVWAFSVRACDNDDVRKRSFDAIDFSGRRVTIGDVVNEDSQYQKALQALAAETHGRLKVSDGVFPKNIKMLEKVKVSENKMLEKGKTAAAFLLRVSFWASLAASSVVGFSVALPVTLFWRVFNSSKANRREEFISKAFEDLCSGKLIENVFSYVFGDGDPNHGIEEKKWKMIGEYIALNGGVVTAEELAPYLDPAINEKRDEWYMVPVLQRFYGQPKVDEEGNILYHFPLVHCNPPPRRMSGEMEHAGRFVDWDVKVDKFLKETKWKFSKLNPEEIHSVDLLLRRNRRCVAVMVFAKVWRGLDFQPLPMFRFGLFLPLLVMYVIYTTSFLTIVSTRPSSIQKTNAEIAKRNRVRRQLAKALESPNPSLKRKLLSARAMAQRISEGSERIVYNSEQFYERQNYERQEWNRKYFLLDRY